MTKKLLCFAFALLAAGCSPVENADGPDGVFVFPEEEFKISQSEREPQYNVLTYQERNNPHGTIEKSFRVRANDRYAYLIFDHTFSTYQCLEDKGRAEYGIFLTSGDRMQKVEPTRPVLLGANDALKVVIDNTAGCESIYLRFAVIKQ